MRPIKNHPFGRTLFVLALLCQVGLAQETKCVIGINVNSFQNFSAADQQVIVEQLNQSGIGFVRTSMRPDDKNTNLAKTLQSEGLGLVLVPGVEFSPSAKLRPADERRHMRSAMPLPSADPESPRVYYQTLFDKLDEKGVVL